MNSDPRTETLILLCASLYMLANALYFQYLVRFCVVYLKQGGLKPEIVTGMRILAGILAIVLAFMSLSMARKAGLLRS
jgi:hypothetical protein